MDQDPFTLWCCSDELCFNQSNSNNYLNLINNNNNNNNNNLNNNLNNINDSCSLGSACDQLDSTALDCRCCQAGCPPSPISLQQQCRECNQTTTTTTDNNRFISPPVASASTGLSVNELDDFNQSDAPIDQDIVWINKELEELIKCCCCDQPTQSETLPLHHADAHPTHHVNFDMLFNPSLNLPNKPNIPCCSTSDDQVTTPNYRDPNIQSVTEVFKCQWKDCNLDFKDRLELTEHVNLCHLFTCTSIASNHQANDTCQQRTHPPSCHLLTPHSHHPTIQTTGLSNKHIHGFLLDSASTTSSSFTHTPLRPSPSIQSFSEQINPPSRRPHQENLLSPNSSTLISSRSSCDSIYDLLNQHSSCRISSTPTHALVSLATDEHQLATTVQGGGNFFSSHPVVSTDPSVTNFVTSKETIQDADTTTVTTEQQHVCRWESCTGKSFSTTAELTEHLSNDHIGSGKSSYMCLWENCYCDRKASRAIVKEQEVVVGGSRSDEDQERKRKVFNQRQKVMRHLQTHTGDRPFSCDSCGKKFGEMATLIQHVRTHTQEKPYKCKINGCEKSFALQSALTIHNRTHTGLKPFKCPVLGCHSKFSESSNLSKHLKIHDSVKQFSCHVCNKKFTRSDQLHRHIKSHDLNNSNPLLQEIPSSVNVIDSPTTPTPSKRQKI